MVRNNSCGTCNFSTPYSIATDGADVWVVNEGNNSITELKTPAGAFAKWISVGLTIPSTLRLMGNDAWVANYLGNSVTAATAPAGLVFRIL